MAGGRPPGPEGARDQATLASEPPAPAPFIVGSPRSGTTVLRHMLNAHSQLAIPPETGFIIGIERRWERFGEPADPAALLMDLIDRSGRHVIDAPRERVWRTLAGAETISEALRRFYGLFAYLRGKPRWGDKTPVYAQWAGAVHRVLPEAHFIHIIRDGRDVALSLREGTYAPSTDIGELASDWASHVRAAREAGARAAIPYQELRYESFVADPQTALRGICGFVDLAYEEAMLDHGGGAREQLVREHGRGDGRVAEPIDQTRVGVWRREMTGAEREAFEAVAGDLLAELGYELG